MEFKNLEGMCAKCRKRKSCKTPCAFADMYLNYENKPIHERKRTYNNQKITITPLKRNGRNAYEVRMATLEGDYENMQGLNKNNPDALFSTDAESPFKGLRIKRDRTTVFYHHFFLGKSYKDIAVMLNTDAETVRGIYNNAKNRILHALKLSDERTPTIHKAKRFIDDNGKANALPKNQKHWLLSKVFGLTHAEIEQIDGTRQSTIRQNIIYVTDRLRTGQMTILDSTEGEIRESQVRLDKMNERNRKVSVARRAKNAIRNA